MRDLKLVDNMRELRIINGYSQQFVSNYIHIARQTYSLYETGRRLPDMKTVCDLADLYHISIDLLLYTDLSVDMEQISDAPASEYMAVTPENNAIPLNGTDARMLTNYKSLPPETQQEVREYVLFKKRRLEARTVSDN
ncbi:XRE family transcriptional regulator [bacterium 1XD21-13]|nr:XRE family transcriptional regulator [bacterium 1XD21-13]